MMKIYIIDNYDSFVYNIVYILKKIGATNYKIVKNDNIDIDEIAFYTHILISPGPGVPKDAGCVMNVIAKYYTTHHILGVCLGHQAIGEFFGWQLTKLHQPLHGVATLINIIRSDTLFKHLPKHFEIGHYHSWVIKNEINNADSEIEAIAYDSADNVMAIQHKKYKIFGLQFHPESVLTQNGYQILENWLKI